MKLKNRLFLLSLVAVLTLLVNLAFPITAFADDETPPPAATEEPLATNEPAATDEPVVEEEITVAEVLEQLPEGTQIIVVDEEGNLEPLATEEAAEIVAEADPMWCPAGTVIVTADCVNAANVTLLLPMLASKDADGVIYFYTPTTYSTNDATFNGTNTDIDQLADNSLTLQGGWDGSTTLASSITFSGNSVFSVPIEVINWQGNVTVNDLTVNGTSGNKAGLEISSSGDVTLNNVSASANGAKYGSLIYSFSSLLIQNSIFNNNGSTASGWGLFAYAPGSSPSPITLINVQASGNSTGGAYIDTDGNATVSNSKFENNTSGYGLDASNVKGTLTLSDVTFNGNCLGDYYYGGTAVLTSGLCNRSPGGGSSSSSASIIPVTGGEPITCDGSTTSVTVMLPNGDFVILACPINEYAVVNQTPEAGLPVPLEDDLDFISAMTALVIRANQPVESLEDPMLVSFIIPNGMEDAGFAIRFWDGAEWVEVDGQLSNDGLYFEATTNLTGTFVFVKK